MQKKRKKVRRYVEDDILAEREIEEAKKKEYEEFQKFKKFSRMGCFR